MHVLEFDGALVRRGFWLYVFEAIAPAGERLLYVGRTGDSSSFNAQSAYNRFGKHLGTLPATNQMRKHLKHRDLDVEYCRYRFLAYGLVLEEAPTKDRDSHYPLRDAVAAMEKALADRLTLGGYEVLNKVRSRKPLDEDAFQPVLDAFAEHFPGLEAAR
jgi:hypothetical protein